MKIFDIEIFEELSARTPVKTQETSLFYNPGKGKPTLPTGTGIKGAIRQY